MTAPTFTPPPLPIVGPRSGFGFDGTSSVFDSKEDANIAAFELALDKLWRALQLGKEGAFSCHVPGGREEDGLKEVLTLDSIKEHQRHFLEVFKLLINVTPSIILTSSGTGG